MDLYICMIKKEIERLNRLGYKADKAKEIIRKKFLNCESNFQTKNFKKIQKFFKENV